MGIPDYQTIMFPLLRYLEDGKEHHIREAIEALAQQFGLTPEERKEILPSGQQYIFDNRVGWARTYMKKAGLIEPIKRGYFKITERGLGGPCGKAGRNQCQISKKISRVFRISGT